MSRLDYAIKEFNDYKAMCDEHIADSHRDNNYTGSVIGASICHIEVYDEFFGCCIDCHNGNFTTSF